MHKFRIMSKKIKTLKVESLLNEIQTDKQFVENLMRRVTRIRWELKNHFEKSLVPEMFEDVGDNVSSSCDELQIAYFGLNNIYGSLIETEIVNDTGGEL